MDFFGNNRRDECVVCLEDCLIGSINKNKYNMMVRNIREIKNRKIMSVMNESVYRVLGDNK